MKKHLSSQLLNIDVSNSNTISSSDELVQLLSQVEKFGEWRLHLPSLQLDWSPEVFEIYGLPPRSEPVDLADAIKAYHPADAKTVAYLVEEAIAKKAGYQFVLRLIRADEKVRLVQAVATVELDEEGEVTALVGIFRDVTERTTLQDLAASRSQLIRSIIDNMPVPMVVLDKSLNYLELSPGWIGYYGLSPRSELIGKNHYDVMPGLTAEFKQKKERALAGEVVRTTFSLHSSGTGRTRSMGAVLFPWYTSAKEVGGLIVMLSNPGKPHEYDGTLQELAHLYEQKSRAV